MLFWIFFPGMSENVNTIVEQQLKWGNKICFNKSKFDHSVEMQMQLRIFPVPLFGLQMILF